MWHETELLPQRSDGCSVAEDSALGSGTEIGRPSGEVQSPRDCGRHLVLGSQRLHVAKLAARSAAVSDRISLLPPVAAGRHVATDSRRTARACAARCGTNAQAVGRGTRQPEREDDRARRATRLRCGKKKSSAASGMWSLTPWDCFGPWSLRPPVCKTAMAVAWLSPSFADTSNSHVSSGPTVRIAARRPGPGSNGRSALFVSIVVLFESQTVVIETAFDQE